jgi:hypothetical protein
VGVGGACLGVGVSRTTWVGVDKGWLLTLLPSDESPSEPPQAANKISSNREMKIACIFFNGWHLVFK